jgi:hypothetical protein
MNYFASRMQKNNPEMEAINVAGIVIRSSALRLKRSSTSGMKQQA